MSTVVSEPSVEPVAQIGKWVFGKIHQQKRERPADPAPVSPVFTDITFVLDRSGSMGSLREAACKAINDYMRTVDEAPGDGCWTLVTFDDQDSAQGAGECFPHRVFSQVPSERRPFLEVQSYQPRGNTALLDALALTILDTKARVESQVPEEVRKDYRVLMVIMTDGLENHSRQYNNAQVAKMIAERQQAGWVFVYLGANQDAFAVGKQYGINQHMNFANCYRGATFKTYEATPMGLCNASAGSAQDTRGWKAEGNQGAVPFLSPATPDLLQQQHKITAGSPQPPESRSS